MSLADKVAVKCSGVDSEDIYFAQQEQERMKQLRECAMEEADRQYREGHKAHCFRCGTPSLVEVEHGSIKVDICVNDGCGAVHLDPGELDSIVQEDSKTMKKISVAVMNIFK